MRFAIDARPALDPRRTGVGVYTEAMVRWLPRVDPEDSYVAWYLDARGTHRSAPAFGEIAPNLSEVAARWPARLYGPVSSRLGWPLLESFIEADAVLATNFLPPPTRRPSVPVVHDLAFAVLPETAPHHDERWHRRFRRVLGEAMRVLVPSVATKDDLVRVFEVDPERVVVVRHGAPEGYSAPPDAVVDDVRRRFGLEGPYLLFVGGIEPRKNLPALVRAFGQVPPAQGGGPYLVLAGGSVNWYPRGVEELDAVIGAQPEGVQARIRLVGYLRAEDKNALLSDAEAIAYPSRYEGFGFPVLEGFVAGVPVLTSNVSCLPEVAEGAALLVDPSDVGAIADGLARLLSDEDLRSGLRTAGRERARSFTWDGAARRTAAVLREVGAAQGPPR